MGRLNDVVGVGKQAAARSWAFAISWRKPLLLGSFLALYLLLAVCSVPPPFAFPLQRFNQTLNRLKQGIIQVSIKPVPGHADAGRRAPVVERRAELLLLGVPLLMLTWILRVLGHTLPQTCRMMGGTSIRACAVTSAHSTPPAQTRPAVSCWRRGEQHRNAVIRQAMA